MKFKLGKKDPKVQQYTIELSKTLAKAQRRFGVEMYRELMIATPVDTGRARWGWNCSIGTEDLTIPMEAPNHKKNFYKRDAARAAVTFSIDKLNGKDTIFITNAVPYIVKLNEGFSRQAPARFFELCFENVVTKMERFYRGSSLKLDI